MIELDLHVAWFALGGAALLAMTVLPRHFSRRPLSLPIVYVVAGYLIFTAFDQLDGLDPLGPGVDAQIVEYTTEVVVIISLASAGLKLDRSIGLVSWTSVWRLLAITMTLTVAATIALGAVWLGLGAAAAILLGGVLAPTDPVLADDVQVDRPGTEDDDEVRFTLTAEAGLNDGLAFPIAHLAVAVAAAGGSVWAVVGEWAAVDVAYRIAVGVLCGAVLGRLLVRFAERSGEGEDARPSPGLFILGATIVVYGITEFVGGYGFLAVFIASLSRGSEEFRREVSRFGDEIERMLVAFVLLGFGAMLSAGVLDGLTWQGAAVGVLLVIVVRPVAGVVGLLRSPLPWSERLAVAFFGIRGMGSIYYASWALNEGDFEPDQIETVWAVMSFTVVLSIVIHGVTASPAMAHVERRRDRTLELR